MSVKLSSDYGADLIELEVSDCEADVVTVITVIGEVELVV